MPIIYLVWRLAGERIPQWPLSHTPILDLRATGMSHLAGVTLFSMLGFKKLSVSKALLIIVGFVIFASRSRGAMVSFLVAIAIPLVLIPRNRQMLVMACSALMLLGFAYAVDPRVTLPGEVRETSVSQIFENMGSILGSSGIDGLDGTKRWRALWWDKIVDYTVHGRYFWLGKGFGVNLADADGFELFSSDPNQPLLRAPHSIFMTVLARAGVPGLFLWILLCVGWLISMFRCFFESRARGDRPWERIFLFIPCYWLSMLIGASFDPALEGPMMGIWFWSLYGIGIAAGEIYRYEVSVNVSCVRTPHVENSSPASR
jgi:hypothetical protein